MTRAEAIGNLKHAIRWNDMPKKETLDMAIKALDQSWIPVSERLPEKGKAVLCSCRSDIIDVMTFDHEWHDLSGHEFMKSFVIAWMPLPKPYKAVSEEEG